MKGERPDTPGLDKALAEEILGAVENGFDAQVRFTQELVRQPSLRGTEADAQRIMAESYREAGYEVDSWTIDVAEIKDHPGFSPVKVSYEQAVNVVARHRPWEATGRSLILNGHIDVVPVGPEDMWSKPPFDPWIEDDWLYGRGSGDMKAGLVANLYALKALSALGYQPAAPLYLQSVTEEECTGNGALACLVRGYRAEAAIIPEPEDDKLVRANVGVIWFRVHLRGRPVHVREAGKGANAIEVSYRIITALRDLEERWNEQKANRKYFQELEHPINFNVGKISGGDWASSVPAWCSFDCRIAIFPGWDPRDSAKEIEETIAAAAAKDPFLSRNPPQVEYNGFFARGYVLEEGTQAEQTLGRAHAAAFGKSLESFVTRGYLDGRVFVLYDDCPCLVYGPLSENIHAFDERVSLSSIKRVTGAIALFVAEWCGLERTR